MTRHVCNSLIVFGLFAIFALVAVRDATGAPLPELKAPRLSHEGPPPPWRARTRDVPPLRPGHQGVVDLSLWAREPESPAEVDRRRFARALERLCTGRGGRRLLRRRQALRDARWILRWSEAFQVDPFMLGALVYSESECKGRPDRSYGTGLTAINWRMHRDFIRRRRYAYWTFDEPAGRWIEQELQLKRYRFAPGALRRRQVNLYFAAALLQIYGRQCPEIDGAFGSVAHRDPVSHFVWGDRVDTAAHEDGILRARRRLIDYYAGRPPGTCGMFGELELASPMDGAPLKVLSGWGEWRGRRGYRRHKGIDVFSPIGAPVYAIAAGDVMFAGISVRRGRRGRIRSQAMPYAKARRYARRRLDGGGMFVMVRHDGNELISAYMHLSGYTVEKGQRVEQGQLLGYTGGTGVSISKPHLHFELRRPPREHFDPMLAMRKCFVAPEATYIGRWRLQRDGVRVATEPNGEIDPFLDADAEIEPLP